MKSHLLFRCSLLLLSSLFTLLIVGNSHAQTIRYVKVGASGNGSSWANASGDLQAMINASADGDQVWVAAGTYKPSSTGDRNVSFSIKSGMKMYGGFPASGEPTMADRNWKTNPTILSGDLNNNDQVTGSGSTLSITGNDENSRHVVILLSGTTNTTVLNGFIIKGGNANGSSSPQNSGGGILTENAYTSIENVLFIGNSAGRGGGLYSSFSPGTVINTQFEKNYAVEWGGAVVNHYTQATFINTVFTGNYAQSLGGGISNNTAYPTLINVTMVGNYAGSGAALEGSSSDISIRNSIIWGNGNSGITRQEGSLAISNSIIEGGDGGSLGSNPQFMDAANGDFRLQASSCAINAGNNSAVPSDVLTDAGGNPRFFNNGTVDIGAYEFQGNYQAKSLPAETTNNSLYFDGVNDFVEIQGVNTSNCTPVSLAGGNAITIEYWFKGTNIQSAVRFQSGTNYISAGWGTPGNFKHILSNSGGTNGVAVGTAVTDGNWHHVAVTWQKGVANGFKSYLDGQLVDQKDAANTDLPSFSGGLTLGSFNGIDEFMNGSLDEVRVWNVARSQSEIQSGLCGELSLPQTGLVLYYKFNHGTASGTNSANNALLNSVNGNQLLGELKNFSLSGNTSNYVAGKLTSKIRYVKAGASGTGTSWADASGDLQAMIDASCVEEVWVAAGTYKPTTATANVGVTFALRNGVKLLGGFPATNNPTLADRNWVLNPTILSGDIGTVGSERDNSFHVVSILDIGGSSPNPTTLDGFIISDGYADDRNDINNSYNVGGGIYIYGNSPVIQNCILRNNFGRITGGMAVAFSNPTISNCQFYNNRGNTSAIKFENSSPNLKNSTFHSTTTRLIESAAGASVTIANCIIWGNDAPVANTGGGTGISYSIVQGGYAGTGNLGGDPDFLDAANGNLKVSPFSCAIDGGTNSVVVSGETDFDKNPRIYNNGTVDMGAYEYQGTRQIVSPIITTNNALHFDGTNDYVSLSPVSPVNCTSATLTLSDALTIEYWFKGTNIQSAVRFQSGANYISSGWGTAGNFKHILSNSGGTDGVAVGAAATDGNWHHVAMTWQKGTTNGFKSYLDGQLVEQKNATNTDLPSFSAGLSLGSLNGAGEFMNGSLDEIKVWNVVRTQAEIQAGRCGNLSLPQTGLLMYYQFNHGVVNGNNANVNKLTNLADPNNSYIGTLNGFALEGSTSNWVAAPTGPPIRYVKPGGTGDGSNWANASGNLQAMIDAACVEQVWVAAGTYKPSSSSGCTNCDTNRDYYFLLKNGVKLYGGFAGTETSVNDRNIAANPTILSGDLLGNDGANFANTDDNTYHVVVAAFSTTTPTTEMDGFTIRGGNATGSFSVSINGQSVNRSDGGGIYIFGGTTMLKNNTITKNQSSNGGGVYTRDSNITLESNTISENKSSNSGGGAYIYNGTNTLVNNLVVGNSSRDGGGLHTFFGGGMLLVNNTFTGNSASSGGALRTFSTNVTLSNNILWDNSNGTNEIMQIGGAVSVNNSIVQGGYAGNGNLNTEPLFVAPASGDFRLQSQSCAINTGNNGSVPSGITTDRAGATRIFNGGTVDMGAFELQGDKQAATPNLPAFTTNNALNFDGSNDFVSISTTNAANCTSVPLNLGDNFTIEYWFKGSDIRSAVFLKAGNQFISSGYGSAGSYTHTIGFGGSSVGVSVGQAATDGNWHHIAMTWQRFDQNGFKSYLDGELVEQKFGMAFPLTAFDTGLTLGNNNGSSSTPEYTNGSIDELRIWNVARTQAEIQAGLCGSLSLPQTGLLMYYQFDHGVANGNNTNISKLVNSADPNVYAGTLNGFALNGSTSNWVAPKSLPTIRYVKAGATGTGSSWADASGDLQAMINANCVEQVWVAAGTYKPGTASSAYFRMKAGVKIYGGFPATGTPTMADRNWKTNVTILSGDLNGDDVITGSGSTLSITNNRENSIQIVVNFYNGLTNDNSLLDGFTLTGAYASDNSGGGMSNTDASPSLNNIIFTGNYGRFGGGLGNIDSSPKLSNVTFSRNLAVNGGGMYNIRSSPELSNVIFSGNSASNGGGLFNSSASSTPSLTNVTFFDNAASGNGGGVYNITSSTPVVKNSIFWGNKKGNTISSIEGDAATVTNSIIEQTTGSYTGTNNSNKDPFFVNAADPDGADNQFGTADDGLILSTCSPAINAGENTNAPTTDIAGNPRIVGGTVDMGAYEYQSASPAAITPSVSITHPTTCGGGNGSIVLGGFLNATTYSVTYKKNNVEVAAANFTSNGSGVITLTGLSAGNYTEIVATYRACVSNAVSAVINDPSKPIAMMTGTAVLCVNGSSSSITFTGQNGITPYIFTYKINQGVSQNIQTSGSNSSVTVSVPTNASGVFNYTLESVSNPNNCSQVQTGSATVTVNPLPTATISGTTTVCQNSASPNITFTGSNATAPYKFTYKINNGPEQTVTTTSGNSVTVAVPTVTAGAFVYSLVSVSDGSSTACSQVQSGSATVTIQGKPTITLSTLQQTLNEGNSQVLCDTDANPVNGLQFTVSGSCVTGSPVWRVQVGSGGWSDWSPNAPVSQSSNNQPHRYQAACDASCPVTYTLPIELTINYRSTVPQNVSLLVDGVTVAVGETKEVCSLVNMPLTFTTNCGANEVVVYSVDGGEYSAGVPVGLVDNQYHNYRVRCRQSGGTVSCVESESGVMRLKLVAIPSAPTVSLSSTSSCNPSASFSGQSSCGSLRTVWYNATTNVALPSLPATVSSQTTSYYARCQTENGCVSEKSNVVTFTLTPTQVAPIITASQDIVCTGTTVTISANCPAGSQTFWNTGVTAPSFEVAFSNVTKQTYWAKCLFEGGCQSAESVRKDVYWNAFVVTLINIGESKSAVKVNDRSAWSSQFITRDGGPELEQSTQVNPTLYFVENVNKQAPRYWTINVEACGLSTDGSLTFDMLATPEMGVIRSFNTHENNAPYFMYANREGWTELYAQNHPAYGFYQDNGAGGNIYDAGLPKGLYKLGIRYWDQKGWGSIYPSTRKPQGNVLAYQEYWFRIQSKDGVGVGAARQVATGSGQVAKGEGQGAFVTVLPNPVTNILRLKVQGSKGQVVQAALMDAAGREVLTRQFVPETNTHQEEFGVSALPTGMYFLKVTTSEKQATLKVVKVL
ncbi:LamG-like jellyroll fold domain-containing protein [Runella sp. SP2]|uniref:LamG-like jellyroll fold domain-containing protein n=1 Tax=Runella sp. SP2 TaxID=2268026 RepID=UPI0013DD9BD8|nr:LamG-like jellyroll fold domain-containing protein [Runella sp. SP2]